MGNYKATVLYQVVKGDTILSICKMHNLKWQEFVALNPAFDVTGHRDPGVIYVGEMFVVGHIVSDPLKVLKGEDNG